MINSKHYDTVTGYIFSPDFNKILLVEKRFSGKIMAPGGHVEIGESFVDALFREIREETGVDTTRLNRVKFAQRLIIADDTYKVVDPKQDEDFIVIEKIKPTKYYDDHIYCFVMDDITLTSIKSLEISKVFWGNIASINSYNMYANVKQVILFYYSNLRRDSLYP